MARLVVELTGKQAERQAKQLQDEFRKVGIQAQRLDGDMTSLGRRMERGVANSFARLGKAAVAAGAVMVAGLAVAAVRISGSFLEAATQAENLKVRLAVLLGSVEEGNRLFQDMSKFASRVPFEFQEIMESATMLAGVLRGGRQEIGAWMPLIGDLAAATGLGIRETTEQVQRMLSAGAASADRFRERGVLAMLGFQAGVSHSAEETRRKLIEEWVKTDSQFRGATDRLAATWQGQTSMMSDAWFQFRTTVMDEGIFDELKRIAGALTEMAQDPATQQMATQLAEILLPVIVELADRVSVLGLAWSKMVANVAAGYSRLTDLNATLSEMLARLIPTEHLQQRAEEMRRHADAAARFAAAAARDLFDALNSAASGASDAGDGLAGFGEGADTAAEGVAGLKNEIKRLEEEIRKSEDRIRSAEQRYASFSKAIEDAGEALGDLDAIEITEWIEAQGRALPETAEEWQDLADAIRRADEELARIMSQSGDIPLDIEGELGGMVHPELDPAALEQMNEEWRNTIGQMSAELEAIQKRAWENVQDIAADAIGTIIKEGKVDFQSLADSILDVIAQMLAKMLVVWLTNLATRVAAEQAAAVTAAVAWAAVGGQSGGFVGGGGGGGGIWGAALGVLKNPSWWGTAIAVLGTAFFAAVAFKIFEGARGMNRDTSFRRAGSFTVRGGEVQTEGFITQGSMAIKAIQDWLDEFERVTGGIVESMADIHISMQREGGLVQIQIGDFVETLTGNLTFGSLQEAVANGLRRALANAEFSGLSDVWDPFIEALERQAFGSLEEIMEFAHIFAELDRESMDPVTRQIRDMQREWDVLRKKLAEVGIEATALGDKMKRDWKSIRDSITGTTLSARERFERDRKSFNKEIEMERRKEEQALRTAEAEMAAAQAEVARLEAMIAAAQASGTITDQMLARWNQMLRDANRSLQAANEAAAAAQAALDALPEPIGPDEFRDRGKAQQRKADMEQIRDLLDQMEFDRLLSGMTDLEAGLARLEREYQANLEKAHGNAELIALLTAEYAAQEEQLRRQIQLSAVDTFQGFMGIGDDPFSQLSEGFDEAVSAIEDAGFGAERTALMIARLTAEYERQLDVLSRQEFVAIGDSLMGIVDRYFSGVEGFEEFRMRLEQTRFELELANLRARFEILKAEGAVAQAVLDQMQSVFDFIDENPIDWSKFVAPAAPRVQSAARGVNNALEEMARRLASAKESISDFLQGLDRGEQGGVGTMQALAAAEGQFEELLKQARGGNIQAIEQFPEVSREFLKLAEAAFASSPEFQAIFERVRAAGIELLGTNRVKEDNVVFDQRFFQQQQEQVTATKSGFSATVRELQTLRGSVQQNTMAIERLSNAVSAQSERRRGAA